MLENEFREECIKLGIYSWNIVNSIDSWIWYNCLGEGVTELIEVLELYPDKYQDDFDPYFTALNNWRVRWWEQLEPLFMIIVCLFGNYGTSPRSGWIERKNMKKCIRFLELCKSTYQEELDVESEVE